MRICMYLFTTLPHLHGHWHLQEQLRIHIHTTRISNTTCFCKNQAIITLLSIIMFSPYFAHKYIQKCQDCSIERYRILSTDDRMLYEQKLKRWMNKQQAIACRRVDRHPEASWRLHVAIGSKVARVLQQGANGRGDAGSFRSSIVENDVLAFLATCFCTQTTHLEFVLVTYYTDLPALVQGHAAMSCCCNCWFVHRHTNRSKVMSYRQSACICKYARFAWRFPRCCHSDVLLALVSGGPTRRATNF